MIVRVAGPGSMLGLYAALSHGVYEVSAESLTPAQLRPVERERFLSFLRNHKEAQMRAVQCICQEYRFALQDACRISLAETVAGTARPPAAGAWRTRLANTLNGGGFRFPLLLTHEEMASMACTTRETVTRTLGQFRKEGWITIEDSVITVNQPDRLQMLELRRPQSNPWQFRSKSRTLTAAPVQPSSGVKEISSVCWEFCSRMTRFAVAFLFCFSPASCVCSGSRLRPRRRVQAPRHINIFA